MWNQIYKWYENNEHSVVEKQDKSGMRRRGGGETVKWKEEERQEIKEAEWEFALMCAGDSQRKMAVSRPFFHSFSNLFPSGWFVPRVLLRSAPGPVCAPSCIPGSCVFACPCVGLSIDFENMQIEHWCTDRTERHFIFQLFLSLTHWTASVLSIRTLTLANANRKAPVFAWCSPLLCGLRLPDISWQQWQ